MRSIVDAIITLSASMAVVHTAQAEKQHYMQALGGHRQPIRSGDEITADQVQSEEDALTKRIEQVTRG
jgi:hypothetical protein